MILGGGSIDHTTFVVPLRYALQWKRRARHHDVIVEHTDPGGNTIRFGAPLRRLAAVDLPAQRRRPVGEMPRLEWPA